MNSFFNDLRNIFNNGKTSSATERKRGAGHPSHHRRRLQVESLEDRTLLAICFVDADAQPGGTGSSWSSACQSLQDALDLASNSTNQITEIWIAEGTYTPTRTATDSQGPVQTATFSLVNGVSLYGGFAGTESDRNLRAKNSQGEYLHQTVLSGDLAQNDDWSNKSTLDDNVYTVLVGNTLTSALTVDGVVVSGGNAVDFEGSTYGDYGGGIVLSNCTNITLSNITVSNNNAQNGGGGIYINGGTTVLQNSFIVNNSTTTSGGGVYFRAGTLTVENSFFIDNYAGSSGGGFAQTGGTLDMTTSHFSGNIGSYGGGLYQSNSGTATIDSSSFISNIAQDLYSVAAEGGGIHQSGKMDITDVTFAGNVARAGGGIYFYNEVDSNGNQSLPVSTYQNLTLSRNVARETGGGLYIRNGSLNLNASIIAANTAAISPDLYGEPDGANSALPKTGLILTGSNNLIGDGTGIPVVPSSSTAQTIANGVNGNQVGTGTSVIDPRVGAPTDSGNGVFVLPLLSGSPALGQGMKIGVVADATSPRSAQTYVVTSLVDEIAEDSVLTFREAFEAANRNIKVGDALAGSFTESDIIVFQAGLTGTIELNGQSLTIYDGLTIRPSSSAADSQNTLIIDANHLTPVVKAVGAIQFNLSGVTLANGFSHSDGGGLLAYSSTVLLDKVSVKDSISEGRQGGGGIFAINATLDATDIIVSGCSGQSGGGIHLNGTVSTIVGASIDSNTAAVSGGGVYITNRIAAASVISNATIARNEAMFGAGLTVSGAAARLTHLTVTRNVGEYSGGILVDRAATVEMNNSIVADNFSFVVPDINVYSNGTDGTLDGLYNLIGTNTGLIGLTDSSNQIGTASHPLDPDFYSASIYNGQLIYTLSSTSPAVNAGNNALSVGKTGVTLVNDVRGTGYSRLSGSTVDIGACEYQAALVGRIDAASSSLRKGHELALHGAVTTGSSSGVTYLWDLNNNGVYGEIGINVATEGEEIGQDTTFLSANAVREASGLYPVRLIIVDANGNRSDPVELQLNIISYPATYVIYGETTFNSFEPQEWRIEAMNAENDPIMSWVVSWGDATETTILGGPRNYISVRHVYKANGTYTISIRTVTYFGDVQAYPLVQFQVLSATTTGAGGGTGAATATNDGEINTMASALASMPLSAAMVSYESEELVKSAAAFDDIIMDRPTGFQNDLTTEVHSRIVEEAFYRSERRNVFQREFLNEWDFTAELNDATWDIAELATLENTKRERATDAALTDWSGFEEFLPRRLKDELF